MFCLGFSFVLLLRSMYVKVKLTHIGIVRKIIIIILKYMSNSFISDAVYDDIALGFFVCYRVMLVCIAETMDC